MRPPRIVRTSAPRPGAGARTGAAAGAVAARGTGAGTGAAGLALALLAMVALAGCEEERARPRTWTVAIYMAADNGLSAASALDLEELRQAATSPYVTVLVEQDVVGRTTRRYRVAGGAVEQVADLGELDTSAPGTLTDFVAWAATTQPSDRTVLILSSDGKGWDLLDGPSALGAAGAVAAAAARPAAGAAVAIRSMFPDRDDHGARAPFLSNARIRRAVEAAGVHVDVLGVDACLMGALEALHELRGLADVLVASEELEPARGWDYAGLLSALAANPAMSPEDLARAAVAAYRAWYEAVFASAPELERSTTLAAFRGDALEAVAEAVDALAGELRAGLADPARRAGVVAQLTAARAAAQAIDTSVSPYVYVDLADLEVHLRGAGAVGEALARATIAEYHGAARPGAHGVSIVFFDRPAADQWGTYDPNYRNWDPAGPTGNASEFINRFQWDELLAELDAARGL